MYITNSRCFYPCFMRILNSHFWNYFLAPWLHSFCPICFVVFLFINILEIKSKMKFKYLKLISTFSFLIVKVCLSVCKEVPRKVYKYFWRVPSHSQEKISFIQIIFTFLSLNLKLYVKDLLPEALIFIWFFRMYVPGILWSLVVLLVPCSHSLPAHRTNHLYTQSGRSGRFIRDLIG